MHIGFGVWSHVILGILENVIKDHFQALQTKFTGLHVVICSICSFCLRWQDSAKAVSSSKYLVIDDVLSRLPSSAKCISLCEFRVTCSTRMKEIGHLLPMCLITKTGNNDWTPKCFLNKTCFSSTFPLWPLSDFHVLSQVLWHESKIVDATSRVTL